jgi:membrane protease subunit HflC
MRSHFTLLIAVVVVVVLLAYMFAFQVRYDQVAVVQTFGSVTPPAVNDQGQIQRDEAGNVTSPGTLVFEPGMYFKWPWPIQKVTTYSNKIQLLETTLQEVSTADGNTVIVRSYLAWRISNPHAFFSSVGDVPSAEDRLQNMVREVEGFIGSRYAFSDLVNNNPEQLKLEELESRYTERLREQLAGITPSYGIEVEQFGIRRIMLPEQVTQSVFRRMQATRQAMAERVRSEGEAQADAITSRAESHRQQILAFARRQAQSLRTEGDRAAAQYYDAFRQNEAFAIFLRKIEALEQTLPHNSTFILDAKNQGWLNLLQEGPEAQLEAYMDNPETSQTDHQAARDN